MAPDGQASLFEEPPSRPPAVARVEFLTGMLANWTLGEKKPTAMQRDALTKLATRVVADAEMVTKVLP
jgi:hypothetical protein